MDNTKRGVGISWAMVALVTTIIINIVVMSFTYGLLTSQVNTNSDEIRLLRISQTNTDTAVRVQLTSISDRLSRIEGLVGK